MKSFGLPLVLSTLATMAAARTNLAGCTSSATVNQWNEASMIWFVPETGEICDFPDCGGGRAPPKYSVPGCPLYTGTATITPSYLPGYGPDATTGATATRTDAAPTGATATSNISTFTTLTTTGTASSSRSLITPAPSSPSSSAVPSSSQVSSASDSTTDSDSSLTSSSSDSPTETPEVPISQGGAGSLGFNGAGLMLGLAAVIAMAL